MITISQLRCFAAVARHQHFTRAAEALQLAQPSVSYQVKTLEQALRVELVEVVGRHVYLTDAGERLAVRATALINEVDELEREMADYRAGTSGRLRLGATRTIGGYALPAIPGEFHAAHPGVELRLVIDNTQRIEDLLLSRDIDLGVVEWRVRSAALEFQPLCPDNLVLVAPPSHPLARQATVRIEDLRGQPFILREPGSGTRALAEAALGAVAATIQPVMELAEPEAIVGAVEAGLGLAFISEVIVARQIAAQTVAVVDVEGLTLRRDFSLVALRDRLASPAQTALVALLQRRWDKRPASEA